MFNAVTQPERAVRRLGNRVKAAAGAIVTPTLAREMAEDRKGSVAIIFAITSFLVVSMVGGAVDLGRAYSAKHKMQAVTDAAALASASRFINDQDHNATLAIQQGIKYFNASMSDEPSATMSTSLDEATKTVTSQGTMAIKTPFLSMVGINTITVSSYSEISATNSLGSQGEVELVMMLDVTGSMSETDGSGKTKLKAMQDASKALVEVLLPTGGGPKHVKIGLAPFSSRVRLKEGDLQFITGEPLVKTVTTPYQCNPKNTCTPGACKEYYTKGKNKGQCKDYEDDVCTTTYDTCTKSEEKYQSLCVTERTGADAFTDASPAPGRYITPGWATSRQNADSCAPAEAIQTLTTSRPDLTKSIDNFVASGMTAGHLGTAWAWYLLSPEWSGVFTGQAAPQPYGTPNLRKIAVLMTDGEYNTYYAKDGSNNPIQGNSAAQAVELCEGMKAKGIEVYTVGFKLDNATAIQTLSTCASDSAHAFLADNGAQLTAAFKEIAFRASPIRVAK